MSLGPSLGTIRYDTKIHYLENAAKALGEAVFFSFMGQKHFFSANKARSCFQELKRSALYSEREQSTLVLSPGLLSPKTAKGRPQTTWTPRR